jgi:hypothetical protein
MILRAGILASGNVCFRPKSDIKMETMVADYFTELSAAKSTILKENSSFSSPSLTDIRHRDQSRPNIPLRLDINSRATPIA